jgi:hypothetical protein
MAISTAIVKIMENWAQWQRWPELPDSLADVERICENLRLGPLFEQLLDEVPRKQRKELSYVGGIRISCLDVSYPCPYSSADDTRDPGDALCAEVFDELVGDTARLLALSDDTKGDFLELTLGAAAVLLDGKMHLLSQPLQRCLHGARLVIEDLARTCEEIWLLKQQCAPLPRRTRNGCEVVHKHCLRCHGQLFGRWRYDTWTGFVTALSHHQCS